jgi:Gpi18-like mannosyltransferase
MLKNIYQRLTITKILILSLLVRLISWPWTYHGDVTATYWWGKFATDFGWRGFYNWLNFGGHGPPDQPMINIYYDWGVRQTYLFFYNIFWYLNTHISLFPSKFMQWYFDQGNQYLLKLPMIFADILIVYLCYKFTKSKKIALILALYSPLIYNSAVWGSGDSIICLFALTSIYFLWHKKYIPSALFFIISLLYKSSLLIWTPVLLIILIKNKISLKNIIISIIFSLLLIYLLCLPFNPHEINPLVWFYQTMSTKILPGFLDLVTANAMNFWALIYGFSPKVDNFFIFNPITARQLSLLICGLFYLYILYKLIKNYSTKQLLLSLVTVTLIIFTFMTRMHERYSFPALVPLLLLCHYDRRFIKYFIIISITHIINVFSIFPVPNITSLTLFLNNDYLIRLISLINVLITLKLVFFNLKVKTTNILPNISPVKAKLSADI